MRERLFATFIAAKTTFSSSFGFCQYVSRQVRRKPKSDVQNIKLINNNENDLTVCAFALIDRNTKWNEKNSETPIRRKLDRKLINLVVRPSSLVLVDIQMACNMWTMELNWRCAPTFVRSFAEFCYRNRRIVSRSTAVVHKLTKQIEKSTVLLFFAMHSIYFFQVFPNFFFRFISWWTFSSTRLLWIVPFTDLRFSSLFFCYFFFVFLSLHLCVYGGQMEMNTVPTVTG